MTVTTQFICEEDAISAALRRELLAALIADLRHRQYRHGDAFQFGSQLLRRVSNAVMPGVGRQASTDAVLLRSEALAAKVASQLSVLVENVDGLQWLYARLADDHSREQFVELLKSRITGQPYPGPVEQQRQLRQLAAAVNRSFLLERCASGSLLPDLVRYRIPGASGPIRLRVREADLLRTFFIQRSAYNRDGTTIRARAGQVVIDAESRWGDTALYFADLVGHAGAVRLLPGSPRVWR